MADLMMVDKFVEEREFAQELWEALTSEQKEICRMMVRGIVAEIVIKCIRIAAEHAVGCEHYLGFGEDEMLALAGVAGDAGTSPEKPQLPLN